jgi:Resolvase, N terminal domain
MPALAPTGRHSTPSLGSDAARAVRRFFREKVTGAHNDRRLLKMLDTLAPGDVVTVARIDRLARSTFDLFAIVNQIVDAKAHFRSLAEPWADTGTSIGRADDCRVGRTSGRGAQSYPHPRGAAVRKSAGSIWADRRN